MENEIEIQITQEMIKEAVSKWVNDNVLTYSVKSRPDQVTLITTSNKPTAILTVTKEK